MRRILLLSAIMTALFGASIAASAATSTPPRGTLTKAEYREFQASYAAMKQVGKYRGTLAQLARHTCRALTDISKLTSAERAECEASLVYSYEFVAFPYAGQVCAKRSTAPARVRCVLGAARTFEASITAFIRTNAASSRAARPRHFSRRCLAYLLFTPQQARTTRALLTGLRRYARAVRNGSAGAVSAAETRLNSDLVNQRQAMSLNITVDVCRHQ